MLTELQKVGINDTKENRRLVYDALNRTINDASSIVAADERSITRETLLMGPKGAVKLVSHWALDGKTLKTVMVYGVK